MELTEKQKKGLEIAVERYKQHQRYTVIAGYAGTGKTTLINFIVNALKIDDVGFCAPTGKAAQVMRQMGNKNAQTIHRLLWTWMPKPDGKFFKKKNYPLNKVIICDEASMISKELIDELLSHKESYIIFCGDPGQLPPIQKSVEGDGYSLLQKPHIFLDEIMRQALESDIIKLSMDVRQGIPLTKSMGKDARVYNSNERIDSMYSWADQIICATNKMRNMINNKMLTGLGYENILSNGMKVIVNQNNWDILSDNMEPLTNGTIGYVKNIKEKYCALPRIFNVTPFEIFEFDLELENGDIYHNIRFDKNELLTGESTLTNKQLLYKIRNYYNSKFAFEHGLESPLPISGSYGYAITCHKAQGSQFNKILIIEEGFPFVTDEHQRWLYTGITRAIDKLVVIKR